MACDREFQPILLLIEALGVVQRLPVNPGFQGDQGDPIYLNHALGGTLEGLWVKQRSLRRNILGGRSL